MVNLTKKPRRQKQPVALTPYRVDLENHIVVTSPEAVAIAKAIQESMDRMAGLVGAVMTENQRFLQLMGSQQKESNDVLVKLLNRKVETPVINIPKRPQAFSVELEKDSDGHTTGMEIRAARSN